MKEKERAGLERQRVRGGDREGESEGDKGSSEGGVRLHAFNCLLWASLQMSPAVPLHGGFQSVEHRLRPRPRPPFKCQSDRRGWGVGGGLRGGGPVEGGRRKGGDRWKGGKGGQQTGLRSLS